MSGSRMYIDGKWVDALSGGRFETINPATEKIIVSVPQALTEDVDVAVKAARRAFDYGPWPSMPPVGRAGLLLTLAKLMERDAEELARLEALDNGKPAAVAAQADVPAAIAWFVHAASLATNVSGSTLMPITRPEPGLQFHAYTLREPVGVVGQIIPWNYPLLFVAWKLAPALAMGNTVVLKPAEQTPLAAIKMAELIEEAGFPPGVVNVVTGYGEEAGAALCRHPMVDKIAFTGSTEVGKLIAKTGVDTMKRITLELGGKSPVVIYNDADVEAAVKGAAHAIFFNQGEVCGAGSRLFVQRPIYDEVVSEIGRIADGLKIGAGTEPHTEIGPLVSAEHLDRVKAYVRHGIDQGARVVAGGTDHEGPGYFLKPTVFADVNGDMKISREEIFGPVVAVAPFDDEDDVIAKANDTMFGLAAGVWTRDISRAHRTARRIRAGTVWVNCHHIYDPVLPFGGFKQSGWGREHGEASIEHYTETKTVIAQL